MFGPGFGGGMLDQQETDNRQRMELAKAFELFKSNNPHATAAEFQAFIDQAAGSDNYLRGGLPGRQVLQQLEDRNRETYQRDMTQRRLEEVSQRAKTMGQLEALATKHVLGMKNDDYDSTYQDFAQSLGGEQVLSGLNARSLYFTPQFRENAEARVSAEMVGTVAEIMKQTGGGATSAQLAQQLGVSPRLAERMRLMAEKRLQDEMNRAFFTDYTKYVDLAKSLLPRMDPSATIAEMGRITNMPESVLKPLVEQAGSEFERTRAKSRFDQRVEVARIIPEILGASVLMGTPADAKRQIRDWIGAQGNVFDLDSEQEVDLIYEMMQNMINNQKSERHLQTQDAIRQEAARANQTAQEASIEYAGRIGGKEMQVQMGIRNFNPVVQNAVTTIAQRYNLLDPATQSALMQAITKNRDALTDPLAVVELIENDATFRSSAQPIGAAAEARRSMLAAQNRRPEMFSDYLEDTRKQFGDKIRVVEQRALEGFEQMAPHERADWAVGRRAATNRYMDHLESVLMAEYESKDRWLKVGEAWDDRSMAHVMQSLRAERQRILSMIDEMLPEEEPQLPAPQPQPQIAPPPQQPTVGRTRRPEGPAPAFFDTPMGQGLRDMFTPAQPQPQQNRRGGGAASNR
jgi:hypothetical protein